MIVTLFWFCSKDGGVGVSIALTSVNTLIWKSRLYFDETGQAPESGDSGCRSPC